MSTKVTTRVVRASFLNVITPKAAAVGADPKFSVQLLIPKTDLETMQALKDAAAECLKVDREGKNILKGIKNPPLPIHDGDGEKPKGGEYGPECAGMWVMSVSSKTQPGLVDRDRQLLKDAAAWYSGIYVRASLNAYIYNTAGNKGITFGLNHLQKWKDGEALSGGGNPTAAFSDDYADDDEDLPF